MREHAESTEALHRELLGVLSHDLRNPLSVILVSSRLLDRMCAPDAGVRKQVEAVARAADEINQMIQDLLDAASIEANSLRVAAEPNEVAPIVDRAFEAALPLAGNKPLTLTKDIADGIPLVLCDRERIEHVIAQLVGNAMRFTAKGGKISIRAEAVDGQARFAVSDTGPGIPVEDRTLVISRRDHGRRHVSQGTGLGVFVARGIVEAHGGAMWIESEVGRGSTFFFTLPAASTLTASSPA